MALPSVYTLGNNKQPFYSWQQGLNPSFNKTVGPIQQAKTGMTGFGKLMQGSGSVLGAGTGGGGSAGGGNPQGSQQIDTSGLFQSIPDQPNFESQFGRAYDEAFSAIDAEIGRRGQAYETALSQLQEGEKSGTQYFEGRGEELKKGYQLNREQEALRTEQNVNEQRRAQSEMEMGVQSRYGGTTGTGKFVSEIIGRSTLENIAQDRNWLRQTTQAINLEESTRVAEINKSISDLQLETKRAIENARNAYQQDVNELRTKKGMLAIDRQNAITSSIGEYQKLITSISQRNQDVLKDLTLKQMDVQAKAKELAQKASNAYVTNTEQIQQMEEFIKLHPELEPSGIDVSSSGKVSYSYARKRVDEEDEEDIKNIAKVRK